MRIPILSRLRLAPRIALAILSTIIATKAADEALESLIGISDILVFERQWLLDTVAEATEKSEQTSVALQDELLGSLETAQWLDFTIVAEQPIISDEAHQIFEPLRQDLARHLKLPSDYVHIATIDTEGPERALTPVVVVLDSLPAWISNLLEDSRSKTVVEHLRIAVRLSSGEWLSIEPRSDGLETLRLVRNLFVPLFAFLLIFGFSIWVARSVVKPLADLSAAAERLGRKREPTPLGVYGSPELEAIAGSFNQMQHELKRFVDDRLQMIAAISHDLRTPLTRLRLFAEYMPDEEPRRMVLGDIAEMEAIISSTLTFASHQHNKEPFDIVDLAALLISSCDTASDAGGKVVYDGPDHAFITCQPVAIRRAFSNLIDNGCKYGTTVDVTLEDREDEIVVVIADDGPGIPECDVEEALRPFNRLETSRNRATGGSGLGLAIADEVVRVHQGETSFSPSIPQGLTVSVILPKLADR